MRRKKRNLTIDRKIELARHHEDGEVVNTLSKAFSKNVRSGHALCGRKGLREWARLMLGQNADDLLF